MKRMIAINTASEGICRTIRAQYWKNSLANFFHVGGGFGATAVIVYEDSDSRPQETVRSYRDTTREHSTDVVRH